MSLVDQFLFQKDDPNGGISIFNPTTQQYETLTPEEIAEVERLRKGTFVDVNYDPYPEYIDYFTADPSKLPINCIPEQKRRFIPSASENKKINKLITAIRKGLILKKKSQKINAYHDLWATENDTKRSNSERRRMKLYYHPPRLDIPSSKESYRPPKELLPNEQEMQRFDKLDSEEKRGKYIATSFSCLRHVPSYDLISQNFNRCLDLYMAPRKQKMAVNIDPEDLLPPLPDISDLPLFPTWECAVFGPHPSQITSLSIHPTGELLASADVEGHLIVWEHSGIRLNQFQYNAKISHLEWIPKPYFYLLSFIIEKTLFVVPYDHGHLGVRTVTNKYFESFVKTKIKNVNWRIFIQDSNNHLEIMHKYPVVNCRYHPGGDYILTIVQIDEKKQIFAHQLSKYQSQTVYKENRNIIDARFSPTKPELFIACERHIRIYDLVSKNVLYKLTPGQSTISVFCVHHSGDHLLIGDDENKIFWFDLDSSKKPYKILKIFKSAVKSIDFHPHHPLLCCSSESPSSIVLYSKVSDDLSIMPNVIPIKKLNPQRKNNTSNVIMCKFHPQTPSLYTIDNANFIRLFE